MTRSPTYVIYHASCPDGFAAAWAIHRYIQHTKQPEPYYLPWQYQQGIDFPKPIDEHDLLVVDFSFPRDQLEELARRAKSIYVIDHHKTAQAELEGLDYCHFDMTQSGAMLTWKALFGESEEVPDLIHYIQDRDLWKWRLPHSKEVSAFTASLPYEFEAWTQLAYTDQTQLVNQGIAIMRYQQRLIESAVKNAEDWHFDGHHIKVAKSPFLQSEIGDKLREEYAFGVIVFEVEDKYIFSLRSTDKGPDVSEMAKKFGGGGHRNAAGFSTRVRESVELHPTRLCDMYGCNNA